MCRIRRPSLPQCSWEIKGPTLQMMVSQPIYLIGSQDTYKSIAFWVSVWVISANCTLAKLSSDPAGLILKRPLYIMDITADVENPTSGSLQLLTVPETFHCSCFIISNIDSVLWLCTLNHFKEVFFFIFCHLYVVIISDVHVKHSLSSQT